jgi:hypothetical protein
MKPEDQAWEALWRHASGRLGPALADRVLREARSRPVPSPSGRFLLSAATAAVCLLAVVLYQSRASLQADQSLADWTTAAAAAEDAGSTQ